MRILATIALSFAVGVFSSVLLPLSGWELRLCGGFAVCGLIALCFKKKCAKKKKWWLRLVLISFSLAASFAYFHLYHAVMVEPILTQCGERREFSATVIDYPRESNRGGKVTVRLSNGAKAVYYGDTQVLELEPGQTLQGMAHWQDASTIKGKKLSNFTSRGVHVLLYGQETLEIGDGSRDSLRWLPLHARRAIQEMTGKIWTDESTAGFISAMLTGERSGIVEEDEIAMSEAGLTHLFAVSGLHCAFLVTLLGLLLPKSRQRLFAGMTIAVLLFYMMVAGMTPSIVRSCIMLIFLLLAPLFHRERDGLTSWSAALFVLLLANPYAAASVSLQLSFAATGGLLLCAGRLQQWLMRLPVKGVWQRVWSFAAANMSASLGALVFTIPLTGFYFNILTLVSPLSNLLVLPAVSWAFMLAFLLVPLGFLWLPAAQTIGWVVWGLVHYALAVARWLMHLPWHALYFSNRYLKYWLLYVYAMFGVCFLTGKARRKYVMSGVLAVLSLLLAVHLGTAEYRDGAMHVMALDVGQGESVLVSNESGAMLVDCGSSNGHISAGGIAADQISSMGIRKLTAVAVSHYHADHTNGLYEVLTRIPVETLYLPNIEDENGVRDRLVALAEKQGTEVVFVEEAQEYALGKSRVRIYPPLGAMQGDLNEQGLTVLCSSGDFDVLITGDMAGVTERKLVETYDLPDIEVLLVSHHGSRYSSDEKFLQAVQPETAIISVGDNSYGHPSDEAMTRLIEAGAEIYRTDLHGDISLTVHEGD